MLKVKVLTVVMFLLESVLDPQKLVCLLRWQIKTIRIGLVRDLRNKHNVIGFNHCYKKKSVANRSVVGALQYATITRPGISFSINKVCQIMKEPLEHHWVAVKRILRYLKGTLSCGLHLKPASAPFSSNAFCDADWASDPDDWRSTSGACIYVGPNLISWWPKKQTIVARSRTEAEYRSLALVTGEVSSLQSLLTKLVVPHKLPVIRCDNTSTVSLAHNPVLHAHTKHMELNLFFVREKVLNKLLQVSMLTFLPGFYLLATLKLSGPSSHCVIPPILLGLTHHELVGVLEYCYSTK